MESTKEIIYFKDGNGKEIKVTVTTENEFNGVPLAKELIKRGEV